MPQKNVKVFRFWLNEYFCSRRNTSGSYRNPGDLSLDNREIFQELFQVSHCEDNIHLYGV